MPTSSRTTSPVFPSSFIKACLLTVILLLTNHPTSSYALTNPTTPLSSSHKLSSLTSSSNNNNPHRIMQETSAAPATVSSSPGVSISAADQRRKEWIQKSIQYYSKVMREERRKNMGQQLNANNPHDNGDIDAAIHIHDIEYQELANKHYFALRKIKNGQHKHAEIIYRRIIDELMVEDEDGDHVCDHAKLAVTTLLLALHLQRMNDYKKTRSVFLNFFRVVVLDSDPNHKCACSAKVLGAYALFEMKQGNTHKSYEIAQRAAQFDHDLLPVLQWRQFRSVEEKKRQKKAGARLSSSLSP